MPCCVTGSALAFLTVTHHSMRTDDPNISQEDPGVVQARYQKRALLEPISGIAELLASEAYGVDEHTPSRKATMRQNSHKPGPLSGTL